MFYLNRRQARRVGLALSLLTLSSMLTVLVFVGYTQRKEQGEFLYSGNTARLGHPKTNHSTHAYHSDQPLVVLKNWRRFFPDMRVFRRHMTFPDAQAVSYLRDRAQFADRKCQEGWAPRDPSFFGQKMVLFYDLRQRLGFCQIPKAGSTFWGRIFGFLTRPADMARLGIRDPFHIEKMKVHTGQLGPALRSRWPEFRSSIVKPRTLKFFFTRNPYSRLWSVFLDKFYLLGQWEGKGRSDAWCDDYSSFRSFLEAALKSDDEHVMPVSEICDPCQFRPHVIGKMETFAKDAEFILNQTLYGHLFSAQSPHEYRVEIEINSTINSNYDILLAVRSVNGEGTCLDPKGLCQRLWTVFQRNGYISEGVDFPGNETIDFSRPAIIPIFLDAAKKSSLSPRQSQLQKRRSMVEAYSKISPNLILEIQNRFRNDFEIFDYDLNPPSASPDDT